MSVQLQRKFRQWKKSASLPSKKHSGASTKPASSANPENNHSHSKTPSSVSTLPSNSSRTGSIPSSSSSLSAADTSSSSWNQSENHYSTIPDLPPRTYSNGAATSLASSADHQPKNNHNVGAVGKPKNQPKKSWFSKKSASLPANYYANEDSETKSSNAAEDHHHSCSKSKTPPPSPSNQPKNRQSACGGGVVRRRSSAKRHKYRESCHTCKEGSHSLTFGLMGQVIPDPLQMWISSQLLSCSLDSIAKGLNGFEELKKYIRQGGDLCKDVAFIIQERAELESTYSKSLSKISSKLQKATLNTIGSLVEGWRAVATNMEVEADLHKNLASALLEDIAKPLKHLAETQHKARKPVEAAVDKALRSLTDKRTEENKAKKASYESAKAHEKMEEAKPGKNKTEKDINKIEKKQRQTLDSLRKADKHYCECCEKSEVARQEWDFAVNKASHQLQELEEERINKMNDYLTQYSSHLSVLGPRLTQCCDSLHKCVVAVDLTSDITNAAKQKGTGPNTPEQMLIDSYAEDKQFSMKAERRKAALQHYLWHLRQSIEREQKGREGVEKLVEVYRERPTFADPESQEEAQQKLLQVISMTNFLEANHFKMATFLAELDNSNKPAHKFAKYIEQSRDKQGMNVSVLKLPLNLAMEGHTGYDVNNVTIGALASDEPFSDDDDFDDDPAPEQSSHRIVGKCRVLFDYQATQSDELGIKAGDIINVYDQQPDGWWQGELHGKVGMFPATYVEMV